MSKKKLIIGVIIGLVIYCGFEIVTFPAPQSEHDPLYYDVQVNAQVVPIYAIDAQGNPVYDLKEDEIVLYINKKPYPLLGFTGYKVTDNNEPVVENAESPQPALADQKKKITIETVRNQEKETTPERIIFIILDGISNSRSGIRNAKKLATNIVKSGSPGDAYIILKASAYIGIQYVLGPEKNKAKLLEEIEKIYLDPSWIILTPARAVSRVVSFNHASAMDHNSKEMAQTLFAMAGKEVNNTTMEYRRDVRRFGRSLSDLKYALKTIRLPKTVFLISGAIQDISGDVNHYVQSDTHIQHYYKTMKEAAVNINQGGSILYMINTIPEVYKIRRAVNIMSKISNAKCINASDVDTILKRVRSNTSAYYEAAFSVVPKLGEKFRISVKCKRKGVTLNTLQFGEKTRTYSQMEKMQKELFALNVVTGGSWSRMVGTIQQTTSQELKQFSKKDKTFKNVRINLPGNFNELKADVFVLNVEPESLNTDFHFERVDIKKQGFIDLDVEIQDGRKQYVVVIKPEKTSCLFSQI